jgi:hypothetical protein
MSRWVYLLGVGMALVGGAFLLTDALHWRPEVTEANVRRIREGMTWAEVEAILGPPSDHPLWRHSGVWVPGPDGEMTRLPFLVWDSKEGGVSAVFRLDGRLDSISEWRPPSTPGAPKGGLVGRLRAWLGW